MIQTEKININGEFFTNTFSDSGFYIERDGILYESAVDPIDSGRVYTETTTPIQVDEQAELKTAWDILLGVER